MATLPERRGDRSYRGLDRSQRDAQRKRRLLDAGLERFGTDGYASAAVESICSSAGVSTRNFYDHFANREALLIAVYDEIVAEALTSLAGTLGDIAPNAPTETWVRSGLATFMEFMLGDPRRARVNFVEVVGASQTVEAHRRTVLRQFATLITAAARQIGESEALSKWSEAELRVGVSVLIGGVQESLTAWLAEPAAERMPLDGVLDSLVAIMGSVLA